MSTRLPSDDPDVDNSELHREVGGDTVATTPMRGMQTKQQRREAGAAALPCCMNPILNQALHGTSTKSIQNLNLKCPVGSLMMIMMSLNMRQALLVSSSRPPPTM